MLPRPLWAWLGAVFCACDSALDRVCDCVGCPPRRCCAAKGNPVTAKPTMSNFTIRMGWSSSMAWMQVSCPLRHRRA
ncbi:MAG TPA: hypothetical protein VMV31_14280 [Terriglobales bacterium]|nr:hypothetical protein [Terriglobales bacterium]